MKQATKRVLIGLAALLAVLLVALVVLCWPLLQAATSVRQVEDGLYAMRYRGDYAFDEFLANGGASDDLAVADFVVQKLFHGLIDFQPEGAPVGCSTISVASPSGERLFGRNFDWQNCAAMVVQTAPKDGYASISTVNMDFLKQELSLSEGAFVRMMSAAAPYAPMDGMNERGLCVAVLMIQDDPPFSQDAGRPDLTTTTAVRLMLDQAADVGEALALLERYDLHASANLMIHFALADATGRSVVVEYVDNEMIVTETPIITNFYLTPGEKYGIGAQESHTRYALLQERLAEQQVMQMDQVRDALDRVSKRNFDSDFASTEWSTVYNQTSGEVRYYHRENYAQSYVYNVR